MIVNFKDHSGNELRFLRNFPVMIVDCMDLWFRINNNYGLLRTVCNREFFKDLQCFSIWFLESMAVYSLQSNDDDFIKDLHCQYGL